MTCFSDISVQAGTNVFGIRFKPFGMRALLGFTLAGTVDQRQLLTKTDFDFRKFIIPKTGLPDLVGLNKFFLERLPEGRIEGLEIMNSIRVYAGKLNITDLAAMHHATERKIERLFREHTGATAKELCGQVRLRHAIKAIKQKTSSENLLNIALDNGFYDHAHLSHTIRKYTGYTPAYFIK
jgi:AraC-like DNA-binding protein